MDQARKHARALGCPYVDRNDSRCANRFKLGRMEQAFSVCFGTYHVCPMYHSISAELKRPSALMAAIPVALTTHGQPQCIRRTGS